MDLGSHATLKDKHEIVLFYKIINGLAPQYMLGLIYSCFATDDHAYTYDRSLSEFQFTVNFILKKESLCSKLYTIGYILNLHLHVYQLCHY